MQKSGDVGARERLPVSFPEWKTALTCVENELQESYRQEVVWFLHHCKKLHTPATVALARNYLEGREHTHGGSAREALRWFFRAAALAARTRSPAASNKPCAPESSKADQSLRDSASRNTPVRSSLSYRPASAGRGEHRPEPALAADDLGGPVWEKALITAAREAGLLWRTEETYRGWARRFARFVAPRTPHVATTEDVGEFLTALAVNQRASQSTQKQALNALVFFLQEGLHQTVGEIDFRRAAPGRKVPTVLTRDECARLFGRLNGTTRLMAQLAYGAGLRLLELLRLRVHHLDLARQQLKLCGAKGDRVNGFANAAA